MQVKAVQFTDSICNQSVTAFVPEGFEPDETIIMGNTNGIFVTREGIEEWMQLVAAAVGVERDELFPKFVDGQLDRGDSNRTFEPVNEFVATQQRWCVANGFHGPNNTLAREAFTVTDEHGTEHTVWFFTALGIVS